MSTVQSASVAIIVTVGLTAFGLQSDLASLTITAHAQTGRGGSVGEEFQAMLAKVDAAQLDLQNGKPEAFKSLWSHADDITLAGGFGGGIEKGWELISHRLDWVGAQYSKGTHAHQRIVVNVSGDLGYVVQMEHIRFHVPGQAKESTRDYRVTMVFRREPDGWRIVHRQADSQMMKQAPQ
jgi:ketosteroid isomerase-like protein